jgi:hypothetical protein
MFPTRSLLLLVTGLVVWPAVGWAQTPAQRADSLEAQVRRLQARIDSLAGVLARLTHQGKDTAAAHDELAALRAAAQAAAGGADTTRAAPQQTQFVGRTRSQPSLNPEISATGDVRVLAQGQGGQRDNVDVREFELAFQSPLDPYASTKIFVTFEHGDVGIEEGYAYWTGLPGHLRLDLGRFRQQLGELNRWHSHELPQSEYPLVLREYFSDEGLVGDGVSLYWLVPAGGGALGTHELTGQVTLANNETLFEGGTGLSFLGHLNNFWSLSPSTFVQVGATGVYGRNADSALTSRTLGLDFRLNWRPPRQANYRSFTLRAEGYAVTRKFSGLGTTRYGGYAGAQYQLSQRLFAGMRYDYVELLGGDHAWALVPDLTWWQSEWVYLRAEYQHQSFPGIGLARATDDRVLIQAVWAIGPHKHETY